MQRTSKYLYIISLDGLSTLDFEYISTLKNFKTFLKDAAYCKSVYSVYPTLTYPAHVSIITGKYPKNHGIINNTLLQPNRLSPDWYWRRKDIKSETLYDLAISKGMKVAALLWPVTAGAKIQYNMPEIFANRPWQNQIMVSLLNGSPLFQYEMNKKFGHLRDGIKQPKLDNFTHESLLHTIKSKDVDLTLVHYTDLDSIRHEFGFHSKEAKEALKRHDRRIGEIVSALKSKGIYDQSTIIILGDHSSLDEDKVINLNVILKSKGFIKENSKGKVVDYKAIVKNCDGSAYVYVKDNEEQVIREVRKIIENFNKKCNCIEKIYSSEEAQEFGADDKCALMLEARLSYYFQDETQGEAVKDVKGGGHYTLSTHGYSPLKPDYTTVFMAKGAGIKGGVVIDSMSLIDEGPTFAKLLGLELKDTDGRVLEEILIH